MIVRIRSSAAEWRVTVEPTWTLLQLAHALEKDHPKEIPQGSFETTTSTTTTTTDASSSTSCSSTTPHHRFSRDMMGEEESSLFANLGITLSEAGIKHGDRIYLVGEVAGSSSSSGGGGGGGKGGEKISIASDGSIVRDVSSSSVGSSGSSTATPSPTKPVKGTFVNLPEPTRPGPLSPQG